MTSDLAAGELGLVDHLDRAAKVLGRVNRPLFFKHFAYDHFTDDLDAIRYDSALTYFYEPFLDAFDPELRKELGVWYTPPQIVDYQVRKVDPVALASRMRAYFGAERFADLGEVCPVLVEPRARYKPEEVWEYLRRSTKFDARKLVSVLPRVPA